jgi:excisionase family DNA binding protein
MLQPEIGKVVEHQLYKITTVMKMLDVCRATVYRLIERGQLEKVKIGTATRITGASVERLITVGKTEG